MAAFGAAMAGLLAGGGLDAALAGGIKPYRLVVLDGHSVKWGEPVLGAGAIVTYALVETPAGFADARNCRSMVPLAPLLETSHVSPARFSVELAAAFAAWSDAINVTFRPAEVAQSADVLIGAQGEPFGRAFTNVAHAQASSADGPAPITRSLICLNPMEHWKIGFDGDLNTYDLRYTLEHEIGHALGLDHPGVAGVLMDFRYHEDVSGPTPGDLAGALVLYGPRQDGTTVAVDALGSKTSTGAAELAIVP